MPARRPDVVRARPPSGSVPWSRGRPGRGPPSDAFDSQRPMIDSGRPAGVDVSGVDERAARREERVELGVRARPRRSRCRRSSCRGRASRRRRRVRPSVRYSMPSTLATGRRGETSAVAEVVVAGLVDDGGGDLDERYATGSRRQRPRSARRSRGRGSRRARRSGTTRWRRHRTPDRGRRRGGRGSRTSRRQPGADSASSTLRPAGAVDPAVRGVVATLGRQDAYAAEPELAHHVEDLGLVVRLEVIAGHQARVVGRGRQEVTRTEVAGLQPVGPRQPRRRQQGTVAGELDDLVDGDRLAARDPGQRDRPDPAAIAGRQRREPMGDDALDVGLGLGTEVLADLARPPRRPRPPAPRRRQRAVLSPAWRG